MGNAYAIMKDERLIFEVWAGKITKEELFQHERRHLRDPDFPVSPRLLVDITGASFDLSAGEEEIQTFIALYQEHRGRITGAKVAIVATKDFNLAKVYEKHALTLSIDVIVFNEIGNACTWLGVDETEARAWMNSKRTLLVSSSSIA